MVTIEVKTYVSSIGLEIRDRRQPANLSALAKTTVVTFDQNIVVVVNRLLLPGELSTRVKAQVADLLKIAEQTSSIAR
jgi:hypothetical protein